MRDQDFFWDGVDRDELLVQKCSSCGTLRHPPLPMCGACQSLEWQPLALSGRGSVHAWLVSKHPTQPDDAARTVVLVDLDEGPRLVSNIEAGGGEPYVGMRVEIVFRDVNGQRLPQFRAIPEASR